MPDDDIEDVLFFLAANPIATTAARNAKIKTKKMTALGVR